MHTLSLIAGLGFDPAIRGILVVALGVTILMGSVYLILATNTGARLGLLLSMAGFFGWMTILTLTWWIQPPGIGPRGGIEPHWVAMEIYAEGADTPKTSAALSLPPSSARPAAADLIAAHPELAAQVPSSPGLSDIAGATVNGPDGKAALEGKKLVPGRADLGQWKLIPTSEAGEAQTSADTALVDQGYFKDATQYKKLDVFDFGGNPTLEDDCPDGAGAGAKTLVPDDPMCRFVSRIKKAFRIWHPPHYSIVQVQEVIHQPTKAGEAPPVPIADTSKPIISVVMIRDQGNVRLKPAAFFFICSSLFVFFCMLLHFRDKNAWKNREQAPPVKA